MSTIESQPIPSAARLLDDALRHLPGDKIFWGYAGAMVFLLAPLAVFFPRQQTPVAVVLFLFLFDHLFKRMLIPDWKGRSGAKPRSMKPSWAFFGFCLLYGLGLAVLPFALSLAAGFRLRNLSFLDGMLLLTTSQLIAMVVLALIFGSALLFLPARAVGLRWNIGDAVRSAAGARGTLIAVALGCTVISTIGTILGLAFMLGGASASLPEDPWMIFVGRATIVFADTVSLYVAAYCLSRLFIVRTGWTPPVLADDRIEPSLKA